MDFQFLVNIDHKTYYPCQDGSDCCENDYCRCGEIEDAKVTSINYNEILKSFVKQYKVKNRITEYCIDRLVRGITKEDFAVHVCDGYYGEEIDNIELLGYNDLNKEILNLLRLTKAEQVKHVLIKEYGIILDELWDKPRIQRVDKSRLIYNKSYMKRLNPYKLLEYKNWKLPLGVAYERRGIHLVDGYHRVFASEKNLIELIVFGTKE